MQEACHKFRAKTWYFILNPYSYLWSKVSYSWKFISCIFMFFFLLSLSSLRNLLSISVLHQGFFYFFVQFLFYISLWDSQRQKMSLLHEACWRMAQSWEYNNQQKFAEWTWWQNEVAFQHMYYLLLIMYCIFMIKYVLWITAFPFLLSSVIHIRF